MTGNSLSLFKVIALDLSEREEEEEQISKRTVAIITIIDETHWDMTIKR